MTVSIHLFLPLWVLGLAAWSLGGLAVLSLVVAVTDGTQIKNEFVRYGSLLVGGPLLCIGLAFAWWYETPKTRRFGRFLVYRVGGRWVKGPAWPIWVIGKTLKVGTRRTGVLVSLRRDGLHHTPKEGDDA